VSKLIVGLGNPGPQYTWTRHNLGFLTLDRLGAQEKVLWRNSPSNHGMLAKVLIEDVECSLLMPMTFMNDSGLSVKKLVDRQGMAPEDILVICDDLTLPLGKLRLRPTGSAGGHNGLKSIIMELGSNRFSRLRMGIDSPPSSVDAVNYVLANFTPAEKKVLPDFINEAMDCVTCWVTEGAQAAMNIYNKKQKDMT